MRALASIFVTMVTVANSFVPQANIPKVLGVRLAQDTTAVQVDTVDTTTTDAVDTDTTTNRFQRRRDARQSTREDAAARRDEFRAGLQEIRDERKQKVLENLAARFSSVKNKWVEHWGNILDRLGKILSKLEDRADRAEANGADIADVDTAIASARAAIADAQASVDAIGATDYTPTIPADEANLGSDVRAFLADFKSDLRAVQAEVKGARDAVHAAFQALRVVVSSNNNGNGQE